jgi:hypothetical protein
MKLQTTGYWIITYKPNKIIQHHNYGEGHCNKNN